MWSPLKSLSIQLDLIRACPACQNIFWYKMTETQVKGGEAVLDQNILNKRKYRLLPQVTVTTLVLHDVTNMIIYIWWIVLTMKYWMLFKLSGMFVSNRCMSSEQWHNWACYSPVSSSISVWSVWALCYLDPRLAGCLPQCLQHGMFGWPPLQPHTSAGDGAGPQVIL